MRAGRLHLSPWARLVAVSAAVLAGSAAALVGASLASGTEREVTFVVRGALDRVEFDVGDADVEVVRGGQRESVEVRRVERSAFSIAPRVERRVDGGTFALRSACPTAVPQPCSLRFRLVVPDNLPVAVRTDGGDVRLRDPRGSAHITTRDGDVDVTGFCGLSLHGETRGGRLSVAASCAPQRLTLGSRTGEVRAVVPRGRYRLDVSSASGDRDVAGVTSDPDAPFAVRALSGSGDVRVEGAG